MNHRTIIAVYLTCFVLASVCNAYLKMLWNESTFVEELVNPIGIFVAVIVAFLLTQLYFKLRNKIKHGGK